MTVLHTATAKQLKQFIEQIERLEEEKKAIAGDVKDKFAEAKALGFCVKTMRKIIRLRKQDRDTRLEEQTVLETYLHALGMDVQGNFAFDHETGSYSEAAE